MNIVSKTNGTINYDVPTESETKTALDFRLKTESSLKRKVISDFVDGVSLDHIQKHTYDVVRYTDLVDKKLLVSDFNEVKSKLESKGYEIVRIKNSLNEFTHINPYRGLNTVVESSDGYKFELQFHTPESVVIKEQNHKLYDQARLDTTSNEEAIRLKNEMYDNSKMVDDIPDAETIKPFDKLKDK